tara:strand:- start:300 stop:551 length:252 start_codon:yes stop_codon:yes gene_type:complete
LSGYLPPVVRGFVGENPRVNVTDQESIKASRAIGLNPVGLDSLKSGQELLVVIRCMGGPILANYDWIPIKARKVSAKPGGPIA